MSTHSEYTTIIDFPFEKVYAALSSAEYWEYEVASVSPVPGVVDSFSSDPLEIVASGQLDASGVPGGFSSLIPSGLQVVRRVCVGTVSDGCVQASVAVEASGMPVSLQSTVVFSAEGQQTRCVASTEVSVAIPMVGAFVESRAGAWVDTLFARECECICQWLSQSDTTEQQGMLPDDGDTH